MKNLIAFTHTADDPASRFRILQYIPGLEQAGWRVSHRPSRPPRPWLSPVRNPLLRILHQQRGIFARRINRIRDILQAEPYDAVFINRDLLEANLFYEKLLWNRNPRIIFDFDDAIFMDGKEAHFQWICRHAAAVVAGNEGLARVARQFSARVLVIPTIVDTDRYFLKRDYEEERPFRLGWLGSDRSIRQTLFPFLEMFGRLQAHLGFEFILVTKPKPDLPQSGLRWTYREWSEHLETRIADHFDAGIMPLADEDYQRHKCGCKLIQYMAAGLPAVASPVGINASLIGRGARGFLAGTEEEWFHALDMLMGNAALRREYGSAGRAFVEKEYSLKTWLPILLELLERVSGTHRKSGGAAGGCSDLKA